MKEVLQNLFLISALFAILLSGCATTTPKSEISPSIATEDRIYFPNYNLSISKPPQEWEMQEDLGEGELVIWLNREEGSIIEIIVSRTVRNLSYHNIATEFNRITCDLVQQRSPTVTCVIVDEKEVNFSRNQFYRVGIIYQGLSPDVTVESLVYLHRTGNFVYHFLFMEEKRGLLVNEMMQNVVFHEDRQKREMSEKKLPRCL